MREIHLRRHAEKDPNGTLTDRGREQARQLGRNLPTFVKIISSPSSRTQETAELMTGVAPQTDERAGFYMASPEKSDAINALAATEGLTFLEAVKHYQDSEVLEGIDAKASELNRLISELLDELEDGEKALVVSHDLSISPAVAQRGVPLESIPFLEGYVINEKGEVTTTSQS